MRRTRWAKLLPAMFLAWALTVSSVFAQTFGAGGWPIQLHGRVQVEPGSNVITLGVKNEEIRFAVYDLYDSGQRLSVARFLSDTKYRTPGLYVRGPDTLLETLIKEKPGKRILKLSGIYYPDRRVFHLSRLRTLHKRPAQNF